MFDLTTASKARLADVAIQLHAALGTDAPAASTLMRVNRPELVETIAGMLGAQFTINDDGQVAPVAVPETQSEDHETETTVPVIEDHETAAPETVEPVPQQIAEPAIAEWDATPGEPAQPETPAQPDEKPITPRAMGRKAAIPDTAIITVLVEKFPGREGSASMARRKLYKTGMTVAQFLAAADENGRGALRKAVARGWVSVSE